MYFIPESEIGLCNVSEYLNQNIKLVREFHNDQNDINANYDQYSFMKITPDLIFYMEDCWGTRKIKSCKIDNSGVFQFFTGDKILKQGMQPLIFYSVPIAGFYSEEYENES